MCHPHHLTMTQRCQVWSRTHSPDGRSLEHSLDTASRISRAQDTKANVVSQTLQHMSTPTAGLAPNGLCTASWRAQWMGGPGVGGGAAVTSVRDGTHATLEAGHRCASVTKVHVLLREVVLLFSRTHTTSTGPAAAGARRVIATTQHYCCCC